MNTSIHNELSKLEVFFNGNLKSSSAVFQALKTIINFNQGYVYFLTPDRLRLQYSFNSNDTIKEISISPIEKEILFNPEKKIKSEKFDVLGKYLLVERLLIEKNVYGILIVTSNKNFSQKEKMFFKTCSMIVSNLIKDIELTQIIKMQTEALQKALVETENAVVFIQVFIGLGRQPRDVACGRVIGGVDIYAIVEPEVELFVFRRKMQFPVFEVDPCRNTCAVFVVGLCFLGRSQYRKQSDGGGQQ